MNKILIITILLLLNTALLNASEDRHSHGIYDKIDSLDERKTVHKKTLEKSQLIDIARAKLELLVMNKKISKTWLEASAPEIVRTKYKFVNDWMVFFHNPKIKNKKHQFLYIFVNSYGEVQGANYTGR